MIMLPPKKADRNDFENMLCESFLYDRYRLLLLNRFKWTGLEKLNITERHIESYLFDYGYCLFFEDPERGLLCLPCQGIGQNVYGDPLHYIASGLNYRSDPIPAGKCVLIENNKLRTPTEKAVIYFVSRLFELVRTMDVNVRQLRMPVVFTGTDTNLLSLKKIMDEIEKYNWAMITDPSMRLEEIIKAISTGVKPLTAELTDRYNAVSNEGLTYFGFNNSNTDKRERLITDEANANNQFIDSCMDMYLESRQRACEEINELFGSKYGFELGVEVRNKREPIQNDQLIQNDGSE